MKKRVLSFMLSISLVTVNLQPAFASDDLYVPEADEAGGYVEEYVPEVVDESGGYVEEYVPEVVDESGGYVEEYVPEVVAEPDPYVAEYVPEVADLSDAYVPEMAPATEAYVPEMAPTSEPYVEEYIPENTLSDEYYVPEEVPQAYTEAPVIETEPVITWSDCGQFPFVSTVTITDENGNPSNTSNFNRNGIINLSYSIDIPAGNYLAAGSIFTIPIGQFGIDEYIAEQPFGQMYGLNATWDLQYNVITIRVYENCNIVSNVYESINVHGVLPEEFRANPNINLISFGIAGRTYTAELYVNVVEETPAFNEETTNAFEGMNMPENVEQQEAFNSESLESNVNEEQTVFNEMPAVSELGETTLIPTLDEVPYSEEVAQTENLEEVSDADETETDENLEEVPYTDETEAEENPLTEETETEENLENVPLTDETEADEELMEISKQPKKMMLKNSRSGEIEWQNKGEFPYVTGVTISDQAGHDSTSSEFDKDLGIIIHYSFSIPNDQDILAGYMYTIPIPEAFNIIGDIPEDVIDDEYDFIKWELKDGVIIIRFYDDLELSNVSGHLNVQCWFDSNFIINKENHEVEFEIGGHTYVVDIHYDEYEIASSADVTKSAVSRWDESPIGQVTWTIKVTPDESTKTLAGVKIVDTFDRTLHDYVPGSLTLNGVSIPDSTLTFTETGFEATFPEDTTPGAKTIKYSTRMTKEYLYHSTDNKFTNKVSTYMPDNELSDEATAQIEVKRTKGSKKATSFDRATDTISWEIRVNYHKLDLKDVKIIDNFKGGEVIESSIKVDGVPATNYTLTDGCLTVNLGDISKEVVLTFDKKITDWSVFDTTDENFNITNEATVQAGDEILEELSYGYGGTHGVSDVDLSKEGTVKIDTTKGHYIAWTVNLNSSTSNNYQAINEPVEFLDNLTDGLTPCSPLKFTVFFTDGTSESIDIPLEDCYNESTREYRYSFTPLEDYINGRQIEPLCWYKFTFDTTIDKYRNENISNSVDVNVGNKQKESTATVKNEITTRSAIKKAGSYYYESRYNYFYWIISYNDDWSYSFKNPVIVDTLPEGHVPVGNSITIEDAGHNGWGATVPYGQTVNGYTVTYDPDTREITIAYDGYNARRLWIYLKTRYVGEGNPPKATNRATLTADNLESSLSASKSIEYESVPIIEKKSNYTEGDVIPWTVAFSPGGTDLGTLKLIDELPVGLSLDVSSVKLYNTDRNNSTGALVKKSQIAFDSSAIQYDSTTGLFEFIVPSTLNTTKSYILEFNTDVMDRSLNLKTITNSITLLGSTIQVVDVSEEVKVKVSAGEGDISGVDGSVKIHKVDKLTNEPLKNVVFQLLDANGDVISKAGWVTTDENGYAEFKKKLRLDRKYYVQEVRTISGYIYDDTMYEVEISSEDEDKTVEITIYNQPNTTSIEGEKIWDDANDQDGLRPESVTIKLLADGVEKDTAIVKASDNWKYSFTNLPKMQNGAEIVYTVDETAVPGYTKSIDGYNITNKHIPETVDVEGEKTWDDNNNQDGLRPGSVTVKLLADGVEKDTAIVKASDNWKYSFTNLPKNKDGVAIEYTVDETAVPGYTKSISGYNITNKHIPETVDVEGEKIWDDANNQDGLRPESVTVKLLADGVEKDTAVVKASDNWKYSFTNLPKNKDGVAIKYTVDETAVPGYTKSISGYNITNKHVPATVKVEGKKVKVEGKKTWADVNNQDGVRPESVTIKLLADGTEVDSKEVKASDNWEYSFTNLPKFKAGTEIVYSVDETAVPGYSKSIHGYNITNKYTPDT